MYNKYFEKESRNEIFRPLWFNPGWIDVNYAKVPRARKLPVRQRMATLRWTAEKSLAALLFNTGGVRATTDATMQLAIINCAPAVTMAIGRGREREREWESRWGGWRALFRHGKKSHERGALSDRWFLIVRPCYANQNGYYGIRLVPTLN